MPEAAIKTVSGRAVPVRGNDIDTDRIIPARYLRCVTFEGLGEHAFEDDRKQDAGHAFNQDRFQGASVLVVGDNFGSGSSREHAPQSLRRWGIAGIVGKSFGEIFFGNCVALGIPAVTLAGEDVDALMAAIEADPAVNVTLDLEAKTVAAGDRTYDAALSDGPRTQLMEGAWNALTALLEAGDEIDAVAARLPFGRDY